MMVERHIPTGKGLKLQFLLCSLVIGTLLALPAIGQVLELPPRPPHAVTGSELLPFIEDVSVDERERILFGEIASGNVPDFLRDLVPVTETTFVGGLWREATWFVTPDYVAVGTDDDFFRQPMTPILAQWLADLTGCTPPTRKMVDSIWEQAPVKLTPFFYDPGYYDILSPALFYEHHETIEIQREGYEDGLVVAGIKKDVVVSSLIATNPGRVVIYGWHYPSGAWIVIDT